MNENKNKLNREELVKRRLMGDSKAQLLAIRKAQAEELALLKGENFSLEEELDEIKTTLLVHDEENFALLAERQTIIQPVETEEDDEVELVEEENTEEENTEEETEMDLEEEVREETEEELVEDVEGEVEDVEDEVEEELVEDVQEKIVEDVEDEVEEELVEDVQDKDEEELVEDVQDEVEEELVEEVEEDVEDETTTVKIPIEPKPAKPKPLTEAQKFALKEKEKAKLAKQKERDKEKAKLAKQKEREKEKARLAKLKEQEKERAKLAKEREKEKEKAKLAKLKEIEREKAKLERARLRKIEKENMLKAAKLAAANTEQEANSIEPFDNLVNETEHNNTVYLEQKDEFVVVNEEVSEEATFENDIVEEPLEEETLTEETLEEKIVEEETMNDEILEEETLEEESSEEETYDNKVDDAIESKDNIDENTHVSPKSFFEGNKPSFQVVGNVVEKEKEEPKDSEGKVIIDNLQKLREQIRAQKKLERELMEKEAVKTQQKDKNLMSKLSQLEQLVQAEEYDAVSEDVNAYEAKNRLLNSQLENAKKRIEKLLDIEFSGIKVIDEKNMSLSNEVVDVVTKESVDKIRIELESLQDEFETLRQENERFHSTISNNDDEKIIELRKENQELINRFKQSEDHFIQEINHYQMLIAKEKEQNEIRMSLEQESFKKTLVNNKKDFDEQLHIALINLQKKLDDEFAKQIEALKNTHQDELSKLRIELESKAQDQVNNKGLVEEYLRKLNSERVKYTQEIEVLEKEIEQANYMNIAQKQVLTNSEARYKDQITSLLSQLEYHKGLGKKYKDDFDKVSTEQIKVLQDEINRQKQMLNSYQNDFDNKTNNQIRELQKELVSQKESLALYKKEIELKANERNQTLEAQLNTYKVNLNNYHNEIDRQATERILVIQKDLEKSKFEYETKYQGMLSQLEELSSRSQSLRLEIDKERQSVSLHKQLINDERSSHYEIEQKLFKDLDIKEQEILKLRSELSKLPHENSSHKLDSQINAIASLVNELENKTKDKNYQSPMIGPVSPMLYASYMPYDQMTMSKFDYERDLENRNRMMYGMKPINNDGMDKNSNRSAIDNNEFRNKLNELEVQVKELDSVLKSLPKVNTVDKKEVHMEILKNITDDLETYKQELKADLEKQIANKPIMNLESGKVQTLVEKYTKDKDLITYQYNNELNKLEIDKRFSILPEEKTSIEEKINFLKLEYTKLQEHNDEEFQKAITELNKVRYQETNTEAKLESIEENAEPTIYGVKPIVEPQDEDAPFVDPNEFEAIDSYEDNTEDKYFQETEDDYLEKETDVEETEFIVQNDEDESFDLTYIEDEESEQEEAEEQETVELQETVEEQEVEEQENDEQEVVEPESDEQENVELKEEALLEDQIETKPEIKVNPNLVIKIRNNDSPDSTFRFIGTIDQDYLNKLNNIRRLKRTLESKKAEEVASYNAEFQKNAEAQKECNQKIEDIKGKLVSIDKEFKSGRDYSSDRERAFENDKTKLYFEMQARQEQLHKLQEDVQRKLDLRNKSFLKNIDEQIQGLIEEEQELKDGYLLKQQKAVSRINRENEMMEKLEKEKANQLKVENETSEDDVLSNEEVVDETELVNGVEAESERIIESQEQRKQRLLNANQEIVTPEENVEDASSEVHYSYTEINEDQIPEIVEEQDDVQNEEQVEDLVEEPIEAQSVGRRTISSKERELLKLYEKYSLAEKKLCNDFSEVNQFKSTRLEKKAFEIEYAKQNDVLINMQNSLKTANYNEVNSITNNITDLKIRQENLKLRIDYRNKQLGNLGNNKRIKDYIKLTDKLDIMEKLLIKFNQARNIF